MLEVLLYISLAVVVVSSVATSFSMIKYAEISWEKYAYFAVKAALVEASFLKIKRCTLVETGWRVEFANGDVKVLKEGGFESESLLGFLVENGIVDVDVVKNERWEVKLEKGEEVVGKFPVKIVIRSLD